MHPLLKINLEEEERRHEGQKLIECIVVLVLAGGIKRKVEVDYFTADERYLT